MNSKEPQSSGSSPGCFHMLIIVIMLFFFFRSGEEEKAEKDEGIS